MSTDRYKNGREILPVGDDLKALIVNGSPRKHGSTASLLNRVAGIVNEAGGNVNRCDLVDLNFDDCHACMRCRDSGACAVDDDMQPMYVRMRDSDMIVLGSPIYMGAESGRMKCFVDRFNAFLLPGKVRSGFTSSLGKGKRAIVVFSCGQKDGEMVFNHLNVRYFNILVRLLGCEDMRSFIVPAGASPEASIHSPQARQMIEEITRFVRSD